MANLLLKSVKYQKILPFQLLIKKSFFFIYLLIFMLLQACAVQKNKATKQFIDARLHTGVVASQFSGWLVLNPATGDTIYALNSKKYFTPASNTKIFTLYAGLTLLPDSVPALKYLDQHDTLFIEGTGDPSLLHPYFNDSTALHFMRNHKNVALFANNFRDTPWGPGWAWEDYDGYFAAERSPLPLYGNVLQVHMKDSLRAVPGYFKDSIVLLSSAIQREMEHNTFFFDPRRQDTVQIPFRTSPGLLQTLLEHAGGRPVSRIKRMPEGRLQTLYSIPSDSLYKRMLQESDNFLAEQLLLLASSRLSDTLESRRAREYVLQNNLQHLSQPPVWVDGSGLSRYNLFSPESMVYVLHELYRDLGQDRLFSLFPAGGVSGTLKDWYGQEGAPYVFAKTGTLANNHCLSGYIRTRKGQVLIFSFMNNHFNLPVSEIKMRMKMVLEWLRDTY